MRQVEQAGYWPKRLGDELAQLLDAHFSIGKDQTSDDEWLPVLRDGLPGSRVDGLRAFRPRRRAKIAGTRPDGRLDLQLTRDPEGQPKDVQVPLLDAKGVTLTLSRGGVKTLAGQAVFDSRLGLLDSLEEQYTVGLTSRCGGLSQQAVLKVSYELKRLAPALRTKATKKSDTQQPAGVGTPRITP
jgi:hypothetical protein